MADEEERREKGKGAMHGEKNKMQVATSPLLSDVEPISHGVDGRPKWVAKGSVRRHGGVGSQRSYVGIDPVRAQRPMALHETMNPSQSMHASRETEKT